MFKRLLKLPKNQHCFLFGARNTGKSTLLRSLFPEKTSLWFDLLNPELEDRFARNPMLLYEHVHAADTHKHHVIIDEVQKVPKLLNVIHKLIEEKQKYFIMSGSSARKLKHGGANLLAGRAFMFELFPLTCLELGEDFNLDTALSWGLLPQIYQLGNAKDRLRFLQSYALTYLKEEIWSEHLIRNIDPFRRFLEVAAQSNGKILNFSNIGNDVGSDDKTIKNYFSILEDTLIGFHLEAFKHSFRKRLSDKPKFYFFDIGVTRALSRTLTIPLQPGTNGYGNIFEHFIILECYKLCHYYFPEYRLTYLRTKDDAEIDLVVERPGEKLLFIEIKSTQQVTSAQLKTFLQITKDFGDCEAVCFSRDEYKRKIQHVVIYPWFEGLKKFFKL